MTDEADCIVLREWAAKLMGLKKSTIPIRDIHSGIVFTKPSWIDKHKNFKCFRSDYQPDSPDVPIWQLMGVIEEMASRGYNYDCSLYADDDQNEILFWNGEQCGKQNGFKRKEIGIAVLKAGMATGER